MAWVCCWLLVACSTGGQSAVVDGRLDALLQEPNGFQTYLVERTARVETRALPGRTPAMARLNAPFQRRAEPSVPYRGRFLLVHGLNDSAYVWRDLAKVMVSRGFDVRAILLEGHGTTPEDMLDVHWQSWLHELRAQVAAWSSPDVPLYLGGFSLGGVLTTLVALENDTINGLLLVSPAWDSRLNHYLRFAGLYKHFQPWVFGGMILEDNPIKYNSIPVNSGWQFYLSTRALKRAWGDRQLDIPVLMVTTEQDSVVDTDYVGWVWERRFTNPERKWVHYDADAGKSTEQEVARDQHLRRETRSSVWPEHRIVSLSHLGLMYAPDNPLFGRQGRVLVCNGNEYPVFMRCMRSERHWYGAQHAPSPDDVPMARATWNPDFATLVERFDQVFVHGAP